MSEMKRKMEQVQSEAADAFQEFLEKFEMVKNPYVGTMFESTWQDAFDADMKTYTDWLKRQEELYSQELCKDHGRWDAINESCLQHIDIY